MRFHTYLQNQDNNLDMEMNLNNNTNDSLALIQLTKKKASKNDTQLEKETRRFNKLVKEIQEQEKQNVEQQREDEKYQQLFFKKVHPLLVELANVQFRFVKKLEEIFNSSKLSKNLERSFVAFVIPILQDAAVYLEEAKVLLDNYHNWQLTLFPKRDHTPVVNDDEWENDEEYLFEQNSFSGSKPVPESFHPDTIEKKSISDLYKELAKLIHPDLEQDESKRHRKEQLMKELTEAKNKDDVHAMLLIKQKAAIINKAGNTEKTYSLQMLKLYNNAMKKKLEGLKRVLQQKIFHSFGSKESFYFHGKKPIAVDNRIKSDIDNIRELQQNLQANTRIMSTAAHLKELLQQY